MFTVILSPIWISVASIPSQVEYISGSNINAQFGFQIACCEVYRNLIFSRITKKLQTWLLSLTWSQVIVPITP